jgi:hypothetical protein
VTGRENILEDDADRIHFLETLAQACQRTGWKNLANIEGVLVRCIPIAGVKRFRPHKLKICASAAAPAASDWVQ